MKRISIFLLLLLLCVSNSSRAQSATSATSHSAAESATRITLGQSIVALNGPWKFHLGDNPQWADPNFDDSQWETVDLTPKAGAIDPTLGYSNYVPGWTAKGHPGYWGYAWYRIRVRVAARPGQQLGLLGPADVDDAYQVFADGSLLGSFGEFPGPGASPGASSSQTPVIYDSQPRMFPLPPQASGARSVTDAAPATQVLAFRVWMEPSTLIANGAGVGGMHDAPLLGEPGVVAAHYQIAWLALVRAYAAQALLAALFLLLTLLACSLIFFDRSDRVYGWLAAVFLLIAIAYADTAVSAWTELASAVTAQLISFLLIPLILGGWVMVWWVWFRLRRPAWTPRAIAGLTLLYMVSIALGDNFFLAVPHPVGAAFHFAARVFSRLLLLLLLVIVIGGIRKQGREGWLAVPAVLLLGVTFLPPAWLAASGLSQIWFPFGAQFGLGDIVGMAFAATMFLLLLRRLRLSMQRQRDMALDVKQAQEVQQVLIPQELPRVPGLTIQSVYRPAREVGGDFFQIIPHPSDESVLIVVGDVTGHGLQAGMLVALIVGAIRATAQFDPGPLSVLNSLNQRLCGRGHAHATCLAMRIEANGACTLANAGHLPPYLNGKELPMPGALPLGMIENAEFSVMHFHLAPGDKLALLSDGVVEAQNEKKELFGFERIHDLMQQNKSAAEIATAAQTFGQQDDISVLAITRLAKAIPQQVTSQELAVL